MRYRSRSSSSEILTIKSSKSCNRSSIGGRFLGLYIRLISYVCLEVEGVFD
jgi:hypothetical protein